MRHSHRPALIIVTGRPATGKTTFARRLSKATGIPLFAKDDFKELLHGVFGAEDREESRKLGLASYSLLRHTAETMLASNQSLIIESNFDAAGSEPWIRQLEERYLPSVVQILLDAERNAIIQRYTERSADRHPAHFDDIAIEEFKPGLSKPYAPPEISGHTLSFDTTDFGKFDTDLAISQVKDLIMSGS